MSTACCGTSRPSRAARTSCRRSARAARSSPRARPTRAPTSRRSTASDLVFGLGPAGTGKTYLAVAHAAQCLERGQVERIVLSRPAVEAGERLGFLPGDMREKVDPYLRPLYDALYDVLPPAKVERDLMSGRHRDRPAGVHARTHAGACFRDPRRGAEHLVDADEDVSHPHRRRLQDGRHRRPEPDRPAARPEVGPGPGGRRCCAASRGSRRSGSMPAMSCGAISWPASSRPTTRPAAAR